jgi:hypothetical protein
MGESVYMLLGDVIDQVHGVGFPPLRELFDQIIEAKVPSTSDCRVRGFVRSPNTTWKGRTHGSPAPMISPT